MADEWFAGWRHVFKLDPEREITDEQLDAVCMSGTDAILVGGSSGVTFENIVDLMSRIRRYEVDCALEVSVMEGAVPGFDGYFVPLVLNTNEADWINGKQTKGLIEYGRFVPWEATAAEGYIVLNGESTVAKATGAQAVLNEEELIAHVQMAEHLMRLPVVYLEYSGVYGSVDYVKLARKEVCNAKLFYGGGIDSAAKAAEMAAYADVVVVGNIVYSDLEAALSTVKAVRQTVLLV